MNRTERVARERLQVLEEMGKVCDSIRAHLSTKHAPGQMKKSSDLLNQRVRTMTVAMRTSGTEDPIKKWRDAELSV